MKEAINVIFMILVVGVTLIAVMFIAGRKLKKCCELIIKDLTSQKAFDPASAVDLPYSKKQLFQMGLRDYRPEALNQLLKYGQVHMTQEGKFFLNGSHGKPVEQVEETRAPEPITPAS